MFGKTSVLPFIINSPVKMRLQQLLHAVLLFASSALAAPSCKANAKADAAKAQAHFSKKCADFASTLVVENGIIDGSYFVPAGTNFSAPVYDPSCSAALTPVVVPIARDLCRLVLNVTTSQRSAIRMEAWLPANWTGRFLSTGNGGLNGCIAYTDLSYTSGLGFAAVSTNNGHDGNKGISFYKNPDSVQDFAYRA